jgi:hypothetical protein
MVEVCSRFPGCGCVRDQSARSCAVIPDGGSVRVAPMFMDAAQRAIAAFTRTANAGRSGFVRGYQFPDSPTLVADSAARTAAERAYQQRSERLQHKAIKQQPEVRPLTDAKQRANAAYLRKVARLSNAWRHRDD